MDVVNIVGDTLGLNAFLDMKGHGGLSFCHRCTHSRVTKAEHLGNTCMSEITSWGSTAKRRTADRQRAIRASNPPGDVLESLGMEDEFDDLHGVLYYWQDQLRACRPLIPRDNDGRHVVPTEFDPFLGSTIGIDHLIGGHGKELLKMILKCIPSPATRKRFGALLISLAREKIQFNIGRIITREKSELMGMSLTTFYILLPFVARAFAMILREVPVDSSTGVRLEVLRLWQFFIILVDSLWDKGRARTLDAYQYREKLRAAFNQYWRSLEGLCTVSEAMEHACSDPQTGVKEVKKCPIPSGFATNVRSWWRSQTRTDYRSISSSKNIAGATLYGRGNCRWKEYIKN